MVTKAKQGCEREAEECIEVLFGLAKPSLFSDQPEITEIQEERTERSFKEIENEYKLCGHLKG